MSRNANLMLVAGARPNFMKIAPIIRAIAAQPPTVRHCLVHTGQHYDEGMSDVFFSELGIPAPDYHLEVGSGSHAQQTARIMTAFEPVVAGETPDCVLVVGDVNSTLACSVVAKKLGFPVAHVEAGLRSGDMAMPEEINRIVTDSISDYYFVTEESGVTNLHREGKPAACVHMVGHVMIDNLFHELRQLESCSDALSISNELKSSRPRYGVVTLHRPSNVDHPEVLRGIVGALEQIASRLPLIFSVHPRTGGRLEEFGISLSDNITAVSPLSYREFLNLWHDAKLVLTDSGGLQEETTALGVPCLTLRENTERPVTVEVGTNTVVGIDPERIASEAFKILDGIAKPGQRPPLWDGQAAQRIIEILLDALPT